MSIQKPSQKCFGVGRLHRALLGQDNWERTGCWLGDKMTFVNQNCLGLLGAMRMIHDLSWWIFRKTRGRKGMPIHTWWGSFHHIRDVTQEGTVPVVFRLFWLVSMLFRAMPEGNKGGIWWKGNVSAWSHVPQEGKTSSDWSLRVAHNLVYQVIFCCDWM